MKYIIDRTKWLRGEGPRLSRLLRPVDGKMCCLGQVGLQCGLTVDDISGIYSPARVDNDLDKWPEWIIQEQQSDEEYDDTTLAMRANDDDRTDDATKESTLQAIFAKHGDELQFIN